MNDHTQMIQTMKKLNNEISIFVIQKDGKVTYVNNRFCQLLAYNRSDIIGQSCQMLEEKESTSLNRLYHLVLRKREWKGELKFQMSTGDTRWFFVHLLPIYNENKIIKEFYVIADDMTKKKKRAIKNNRELDNLMKVNNALDEASIVAITNKQGVITYVNKKFCEISQYSEEELIGQNHRIINSGYHPHSFFKCMWRTIGRGETWNGEVRNKAKDGTYYWMNTTIVPVLNCDKKPEQYISIRSDITDRVQAENELKAVMQNDFKKVVKNLENWVFKVVKDKDNFFISLSEGKLAKLLNLETAYVRDRPFVNLLNSDNEKELKDIIEKAFSGRVISRELAFGDRHLNMTLSPVTTDGNIVEVVGSVIDMTKRKKAEDMIYYMAHYDTLTGLINRAHFTSLLRKEIKKAKEMDETFTILFIDLDRFKSINDSLGHITGDKVLRKVTKFFKQTFREQDIISRQGGDEFIALLPNTNRKQAKEITKNIFKQLAKPFKLEHFDLYVSASIGISSFPKDGTNEELLIKNADAAMYEAKKSGKNTFKFYTKDLHDSIISRIHLENDLRKAIDYGELELYYQPKMNIIDGEINGVEALVRWNHPKHGLVPPDQFIFIAEETGLIVRIGEWVLKEACRQTKKWQEHNFPNLSVAVNISLRQFLQNDLHETIAEALEESGLDPKFLEIEITESMTSDANHTIESLNKIKALGVQVSIDDFGTGYSSLSYLSKFPVDRLKIDKSFVMNLSDNNKAIIKSIIDVANNLNIKIIAEGVETEEHVQFLASQNCSEAQGFYFSRPLPVRKLEKKFKTVRL